MVCFKEYCLLPRQYIVHELESVYGCRWTSAMEVAEKVLYWLRSRFSNIQKCFAVDISWYHYYCLLFMCLYIVYIRRIRGYQWISWPNNHYTRLLVRGFRSSFYCCVILCNCSPTVCCYWGISRSLLCPIPKRRLGTRAAQTCSDNTNICDNRSVWRWICREADASKIWCLELTKPQKAEGNRFAPNT